jgi:DNA adenine methylase
MSTSGEQGAAKLLKWWPEKLTAPTKIYGGKHYLCRRHLELVPDDAESFYDIYGGTGVMALNAPPHLKKVVYNDLDPHKWAVMKAIKCNHEELTEQLRELKYSEETFRVHREIYEAQQRSIGDRSVVALAVTKLVVNRMSRGADEKTYGWSDRLRRKMPEYLSAWGSMVDSIPTIHRRLQKVTVKLWDAMVCLHSAIETAPKPCIYLDPPYVQSTRVAPTRYDRFEVTLEHHRKLASACRNCGAYIMIAGYRNPHYDEWFKHYRRIDINQASHSGQGKTKKVKVESLWMNF